MPWRWLFWITLLVLAAGAATVLALPVRFCWASGFGTGGTAGVGRGLLCALLLEGPYLLAGAAAVLSRGSRWQGVVVLVCSCWVAAWTAFSAPELLPQAPRVDRLDYEAVATTKISYVPAAQYPLALLALFIAALGPAGRAPARWNVLALAFPPAGLLCGLVALPEGHAALGGLSQAYSIWFGFCALGVVAAAIALARGERLRGLSIVGFLASAILVVALSGEAVAWVLWRW